jgi:hypothetical protein
MDGCGPSEMEKDRSVALLDIIGGGKWHPLSTVDRG